MHCRAEYVFFVNSQMGDHLVVKHTSALLSDLPLSANVEDASTSGLVTGVQWGREGDRVYVKHSKPVKQVCWHARGDYVATLTADGKVLFWSMSSKLILAFRFRMWCLHSPTV